jgi:maltose O-acetyltransferase
VARVIIIKRLIKLIYFSFYNLFVKNFPSQNSPHAMGSKLRIFFLRPFLKYVGKNVNVQPGVNMHPLWNISIGNNSGIGRGSYLSAEATIEIGNDVLIGSELMILTTNHELKKDIPIIRQGMTRAPVKIGDDVWIGARVIILPGVEIGNGAVVGAGSVITKKVDPYTIVAGIPARKIRDRT